MKLPDEYDDEPKMSISAVNSILGVTLFVAAILVLVLVLNHKNSTPATQQPGESLPLQNQKQEQAELPLGGGSLSPDDLDFWDYYSNESKEETPSQEPQSSEVVSDPATDGKHTKITNENGEEEWILISPYLAKHEYDFTKLVCQSNLMKYFQDGKKTSYVGVDISKYEDYVDFVKLRKAGVDYCMIRVGARGYSTGQLLLDDYYMDNIKRATDAGLQVGLYFYSQAITPEEATEEANMVLGNIGEYAISYPIAFVMESIPNDTSRIDELTKNEKTTIAQTFLDAIAQGGYIPMLYGTKEWLLQKVDLSKLGDYDIWLSQPGDLPDYPYRFGMWQYSNSATIDGISGYANLNVSFIDYSLK